MRRRELSGVLIGSVAGAMLVPKTSEAQSCTPPCYPRTAAEITANVTPADSQYPALDIRRYRATSDPDDTAAFVRATAVANVQAGEIFVPAGTWNISSPLALPFNTSLKGVGRRVSLIKVNGAFTGVSVTAATNSHATSQAHTRIEGVGFVGSATAQGALYFARVNWIVVRDCSFVDFPASGAFGIELLHCFNWKVEHCYFENIHSIGLNLVAELDGADYVGCNHGVFGPNNDINGNNQSAFIGVSVGRAQNIVISENNFEGSGNGNKAIELNGSEGVWICGNYIEQWTQAAIAANSAQANRRVFIMENVVNATSINVCNINNVEHPNDNVVFAMNRFADINGGQTAVYVGGTTNFCEFNNDRAGGRITEQYAPSCITARALQGSTTWSPGTIVSGAVNAVNVNVLGAVPGDPCLASFNEIGARNVLISAHVAAANTVRVMLNNREGASVAFAAGTVSVKVFK